MSVARADKCEVCRALLDEEDMFCANCGREAPHVDGEREADEQALLTHQFDCNGCGASMSYDASAQNLRCPFCGSERLEQQEDRASLQPRGVIPQQIRKEEALQRLRRELKGGFWRPSDLAERAVVTKLTAVYVPYWVFRANTHTYWTADTDRTPPGARGDWYPLFGEHRSRYSELLVGASGSLTAAETAALCPFDLQAAVAPSTVDLDNVIVERFRVQRKYARPHARNLVESLERKRCATYVPGRSRNVKVNVRLFDLASYPILLPIWIMAYQYEGRVFRFLVNGQTGKATGRFPFSMAKLLKILAIVAGVGLAVAAVLGVIAAIAAALQ